MISTSYVAVNRNKVKSSLFSHLGATWKGMEMCGWVEVKGIDNIFPYQLSKIMEPWLDIQPAVSMQNYFSNNYFSYQSLLRVIQKTWN